MRKPKWIQNPHSQEPKTNLSKELGEEIVRHQNVVEVVYDD